MLSNQRQMLVRPVLGRRVSFTKDVMLQLDKYGRKGREENRIKWCN